MTAVYAIATVGGLAGLIAWSLARGIRAEGEAAHFDPESRFGVTGRAVVAGMTGFGMAGMSSTFGGWPTGLAVVAALSGGVVLAYMSRYFGPELEGGEQ